MSVSQLVASVLVDGVPMPLIDTRLVLDEGWSPRCASTFTIPYTPARAAALDPRDGVRVLVEIERRWADAITLDDLSERWYTPPIPPGPPAVVLRRNHSANPSIEVNTAGWAGIGTTAIARDTTTFHGGQASLKVTPAASDAGARYDVPGLVLTIGTTYTAAAWVRGLAGESWRWRIRTGVNETSTTFTMTGSWQRVSVSRVADSTGPLVVLLRESATPILHTAWIDEVLIEASATVGAYFDGSTPDTPDRDYAWTGAANASASTESTVFYPGDPGTTLDDLSAAWAGLTLDDLTAAWLIEWGNGARPSDVVTADLILRERTIDHTAATIALRATSDELLAQDAHVQVVRPVEPLPERLFQLLAAGHVPIGPDPDFTAGAIFVAMPAQTTEWSQSIWDSMQANATSVGLRLWCDEGRVWRLGPTDAPPVGTVDLPRVSDAVDAVNRDGDYADLLVWVGKGINEDGLPLTESKTWPLDIPNGPYKASVVEHDYGTVGAGLPMPTDEELAARLTLLQTRDRVLTLTAPADPTIRPGVGVRTGAPSLPATTSTVARVEWSVPADTMTITTRSTTEP